PCREEKHNPKSRKCPECPKEFSTSVACRRHVMYTHYSSRLRFPCKYCFRRYKDLLNLHYHMALSHIREQAPIRRCQQCDYETYNRRSMQGHMRRNHGSLLQCRQCEQKFSLPAELTRHMRLRHSAQGRQDCPHCTRSFVCPKAHALHVTMHQDGSGHECGKCKRLFESEALLKHHQESHLSDAKGRRCQICKHTFVSVLGLSNHIRSHTGERPFRCKECGAAFLQPGTLKEHVVLKHSRAFSNSCPFCNKGFVGKNKLRRHLQA
ncbi:zinc finger protein, putative, partial [Ixodes scapularis]